MTNASPLVAFLVAQPTAVAALLAAHLDDGRGHCRGCASDTGRAGPTWPCTLHVAAAAARLVIDGSDLAARRVPGVDRY